MYSRTGNRSYTFMITSVFSTFRDDRLIAEEDVRERLGRVGGPDVGGGMVNQSRSVIRSLQCRKFVIGRDDQGAANESHVQSK